MNNAMRQQFLQILENELDTLRTAQHDAQGYIIVLQEDTTKVLQKIDNKVGFQKVSPLQIESEKVFKTNNKMLAIEAAKRYGRTARVISARDYLANEVHRLAGTIAREARTIGRLR